MTLSEENNLLKAKMLMLSKTLIRCKGSPDTISEYNQLYSSLPSKKKDLFHKILAAELARELDPDYKLVELLSVFWRKRVPSPRSCSEILNEKYKAFLDDYRSFSNYTFLAKDTFYSDGIYASLSSKDRKLADLWIPQNSSNKEYETAKMLSARAAEIVVMNFYKSMGHRVKDVAVTQVRDTNSTNWKIYDLAVDGKTLVDVKNARVSIGREKNGSYSEHAVSETKLNRRGNNVVIFGVLSPHLTLKAINKGVNGQKGMGYIQCLGEVRRSEIQELEKQFCSSKFKVALISKSVSNSKELIPPWLYSFPERFYGYYGNELKNQSDDVAIPEWAEVQKLGIHPISFQLSKLAAFPESWLEELSPWQRDFTQTLASPAIRRRSLPFLFLTIFTHFIKMIETSEGGYRPADYRKLLYTTANSTHTSKNRVLDRPLNIFDPLGTVDHLCETLDLLWQHKDSVALSSYTSFRFKGRGLLRGTKRVGGSEDTLIAYCGGWFEKSGDLRRGPCGYTPLIAGINKICPICKYLICIFCSDDGFCSKDCKRRTQQS